METKTITLYGKFFFTPDLKMSLDDNLFFDLNKVSFLSEEMFSEMPLENGNFELSFYFTFLLDGILFKIVDNNIIEYRGNQAQKQINKHYDSVLVFKLRKLMLTAIFSN